MSVCSFGPKKASTSSNHSQEKGENQIPLQVLEAKGIRRLFQISKKIAMPVIDLLFVIYCTKADKTVCTGNMDSLWAIMTIYWIGRYIVPLFATQSFWMYWSMIYFEFLNKMKVGQIWHRWGKMVHCNFSCNIYFSNKNHIHWYIEIP